VLDPRKESSTHEEKEQEYRRVGVFTIRRKSVESSKRGETASTSAARIRNQKASSTRKTKDRRGTVPNRFRVKAVCKDRIVATGIRGAGPTGKGGRPRGAIRTATSRKR